MKKVTRREFLKVTTGALSTFVVSGFLPEDFLLAKTTQKKKRTYLIALDGCPASYLNPQSQDAQQIAPNLSELMKNGTSFTTCTSTLPALTICSHTSIITSAPTGDIGVYGAGAFYGGLDAEGGAAISRYSPQDIQTETLFDVVKSMDKNAVTACISGKGWVAQAFHGKNCDISATGEEHPSYLSSPESYVLGGAAQKGEKDFPPRLCFPSDEKDVLTDCLAFPGFDVRFFPSDKWVIEGAKEIIKKYDPDFFYILLAGMDDAGHAYGNFQNPRTLNALSNPDAIKNQLRITDRCVGDFVAFLKDTNKMENTVMAITADHGMSTMVFHEEDDVKRFDIGQIKNIVNKNSRNVVDVRGILERYGLKMKAKNFLGKEFSPDGAYEWCGAEGPNGYIFGVEKGYEEKITQALADFNKHHPDAPLWAVLTKEQQISGKNEFTTNPYALYNKTCAEGKSRVKWPDVFVFLKQHFMVPFYYDQLKSGGLVFMKKMKLPFAADLAFIPGFHGTYSEQHVPLIFYGKGVPKGSVVDKPASTLDIASTLCALNAWRKPASFKGRALL